MIKNNNCMRPMHLKKRIVILLYNEMHCVVHNIHVHIENYCFSVVNIVRETFKSLTLAKIIYWFRLLNLHFIRKMK